MALVADNYLDLTMFSSQDVLILQHIPQQGTTSNPLQTLTAEESTNKKPSISTHPSFSMCTMIRNSLLALVENKGTYVTFWSSGHSRNCVSGSLSSPAVGVFLYTCLARIQTGTCESSYCVHLRFECLHLNSHCCVSFQDPALTGNEDSRVVHW